MVFQNYALYPHMTRLREHGLRPASCASMPEGEIDARVREVADMLGLDRAARPQAQGALRRPAPARRRRPRDRRASRRSSSSTSRCPTSTPSSASRCAPRLQRLQRRLGIDHDLRHPRPGRGDDDGDRIVVMNGGVIAGRHAAGGLRPPANRFVAGFIGTPPMNFFDGEIAGGRDGPRRPPLRAACGSPSPRQELASSPDAASSWDPARAHLA